VNQIHINLKEIKMKLLLSILLFIIPLANISAQDKYEKSMKKNLSMLDSAKTVEDFLNIANGFERIALAERDKWLPYYYSSLAYTIACFTDSSKAKKDDYLDMSDKFVSIADSLEPGNSEIYTLKGMIAQARLGIDPMNRWMKYGAESDQMFKKAMEIDSLNPRPEYLIGVGLFYTPQQFGGGPKTAKPYLERSLAKFNQFKTENDLMPDWGRDMVEQFLNQIAEADTTKAK
jgi:hypothetical protein